MAKNSKHKHTVLDYLVRNPTFFLAVFLLISLVAAFIVGGILLA